MPLKLTVLVPPELALLEMVIVPVAAPVAVGSKFRFRLSDWPGLRVAGKVAPDMAKAPPDKLTEFTVTAELPDEVRVRVLVAVVLMLTLPKSMPFELNVS